MPRAHEREIEANGLRFETLMAGPADGEAVILLHGYPQSGSSWSDTVNWLAEQGYRALAPSLRGYSPGANPPDAAAYAMGELASDVIGIADAEGVGRFHLVGHDWGGALAWMVATVHPDRLLSLTVLSTPHPAALRKAMGSSTQMLRSSYMGLFRIPRVPELLLQLRDFSQLGLGLRISGLPNAAWKRDRAQLRRVGGMRGPLNWYRGTPPPRGPARPVTAPTLFIWGRHDLFLGRRAAELTEQFVSGEYRFEVLDAGHWIVDRNQDELHSLLGAWLPAHRAASATPAASASSAAAQAGASSAATGRGKPAAATGGATASTPGGAKPSARARAKSAAAGGAAAAAKLGRKGAGGTGGKRKRGPKS